MSSLIDAYIHHPAVTPRFNADRCCNLRYLPTLALSLLLSVLLVSPPSLDSLPKLLHLHWLLYFLLCRCTSHHFRLIPFFLAF